MNNRFQMSNRFFWVFVLVCFSWVLRPAHAVTTDISNTPLFLGGNGTPLVMLVMGRDHKLYFPAYNDASDLSNDGVVDVGYRGWKASDQGGIDYYGYFDSYRCYTYSSGNTRFEPADTTLTKKCPGQWSGDFLNYLTTSRVDALRRVLYGGYRVVDSTTDTVLERSYITQDSHTWGKEYQSIARDGYNIHDYTPYSAPTALGYTPYLLFANTTLLCPGGTGASAGATDGSYVDPGCQNSTLVGDTFRDGTNLPRDDSGININKPLLRVVPNTKYRIWEWVSIERPLGGGLCATGNNVRAECVISSSSKIIAPSSFFKNGQVNWSRYNTKTDTTTYKNSGGSNKKCQSDAPADSISFANWVTACQGTLISSGTMANIDSSVGSTNQNYMTLITGTIVPPITGQYTFTVDGASTVEFLMQSDPIGSENSVTGLYGNKTSWCSLTGICNSNSGTANLTANQEYTFTFRHRQRTSSPEGYRLLVQAPLFTAPMENFVVRVQTCVSGKLEPECRGYPQNSATPTYYKPAGLLQQYGEDDPERMAFGLITGSYKENLSGGIVRRNIGPLVKDVTSGATTLKAEINPATGQFYTTATGIISTLDRLRIYGYGSNYYHHLNCNVPETTPFTEGRCRMWGNPIGEMMYESLNYFANKSPTTAFQYTASGSDDAVLGLPLSSAWLNPYRVNGNGVNGGYPQCSKPFTLVVSDINPSYDTDQVPDSNFTCSTSTSNAGAVGNCTLNNSLSPALSSKTLAQTIWSKETEASQVFIGDNGTTVDNAPTVKSVSNFNIRGLAPEEPSKQGGFYAATTAYYGHINKFINASTPVVDTLAVALASPLPRLQFPVGSGKVTVLPFGKTVGGCLASSYVPNEGILVMFIEKIANMDTSANHVDRDTSINGGRPYAKFRVNFEDSEFGSDYDMDAISLYEIKVNADSTISVAMSSDYAAGGCHQHMGYVISGTNHDGLYLEVRDSDTSATSDENYALDTPVYYPTTSTTGCSNTNGCYTNTTDFRSVNYVNSAQPGDIFTQCGPSAATQLPNPSSQTWAGQSGASHSGNALPLTACRTFTATGTSADYIKHDPLWYAAKWGGFIDQNGDHLPDPGEWDSRVTGTPDTYFLVTNPRYLKQQLGAALQEIVARTSSAAAVAVNSGTLNTGSRLYQARFNSKDWSGQMLSFPVGALGVLGTQLWDAGVVTHAQDSATGRAIITSKPSTRAGIKFAWPSNPATPGTTDLDIAQVNALTPPPTGTPPVYDYAKGEAVLNYLRGDATNEVTEQGEKKTGSAYGFRYRSSGIGDIIYSNPFYEGISNSGYRDALESSLYSTFRRSTITRRPLLYVGSNDGMLHAFDVETGKELLAYIPSVVFKKLVNLSQLSYNSSHLFYVDSSPRVDDAFVNSAWRSLLLGRLGAGGQGVFVLDVTNPGIKGSATEFGDFAETNASNLVWWEFTDADDVDLGYTFGQSAIAKMNSNQWAVVFGNGYNSESTLYTDGSTDSRVGSGRGVLFLISADKPTAGSAPTVIKKMDTNTATNLPSPLGSFLFGGLSTPYIYDLDGDNKVDWIYAGDLQGNVWKFDVSDSSPASWTVKLLFTATDSTGKRQPITSSPIVIPHPKGGVMVLFGTGKYLGPTDITSTTGGVVTDPQTYYGIWDQEQWVRKTDGSWDKTTAGTTAAFSSVPFPTTCRSQNGSCVVKTQAFTNTVTVSGNTYRTSSQNMICWQGATCTDPANANATITGTARGWYIDLPGLVTNSSERVTGDSIISDGRVIFTSNAPSSDPCAFGGDSWLNLLDALTGSRLDVTRVDAATKQAVLVTIPDPNDATKTISVAPSSEHRTGISSAPTVIQGQGVDYVYTSNSGNGSGPTVGLTPIKGGGGRQSWRQIDLQ